MGFLLFSFFGKNVKMHVYKLLSKTKGKKHHITSRIPILPTFMSRSDLLFVVVLDGWVSLYPFISYDRWESNVNTIRVNICVSTVSLTCTYVLSVNITCMKKIWTF